MNGQIVWRIVSGGQTGVDQAALRAARRLGLAFGGWCPPDGRSEAGPIPKAWGLTPTPRVRSERAPNIPRSLRTEWNVRDSQGTLILRPSGMTLDPGTAWTRRAAKLYDKPCLLADPADEGALSVVRLWLQQHPIGVLNVAGPSEGTCPGIGQKAFEWMHELLESQVTRKP